jgi:hypothetical protein
MLVILIAIKVVLCYTNGFVSCGYANISLADICKWLDFVGYRPLLKQRSWHNEKSKLAVPSHDWSMSVTRIIRLNNKKK